MRCLLVLQQYALQVNSKGHMDYWNFAGQFIIMLLIQFGGLSYLTITTFTLLLLTGARIGLRTRITLASQWNVNSLQGVVKLLGFTVRFALLVELIGALLLSIINQYIFNQGKPLGVSLLKYVKYAFFSLVQNIGNLFRGFITHIDYFIGSLDKPS